MYREKDPYLGILSEVHSRDFPKNLEHYDVIPPISFINTGKYEEIGPIRYRGGTSENNTRNYGIPLNTLGGSKTIIYFYLTTIFVSF